MSIMFGGLFCSCQQRTKAQPGPSFNYESFRDSIKEVINNSDSSDTTNLFDSEAFIPGKDSLAPLLVQLDTLIRRDSVLMQSLDTLVSRLKNQKPFSKEEKAVIKSNLAQLDSFLLHQNQQPRSVCTKNDCMLFIDVDKSTQTLHLYIDGELKDTFKVSTGMKGYETPAMDLKPRGPVLAKYTSTKYPGGNYKGLGNMPYVVFLRGGYAIHGTTPGNFKKLGRKASHGCIRLHPDHAVILFELVKLIGLENTWVSVRES